MKVRLKGWLAPQKMADNLFKEFQSIASAELAVYREINTGNERIVVLKTPVRGTLEKVEVGSSVIESGVAGDSKKSAKKGSPTQVAKPINPEELILHTRLRYGKISYDHNDVKVRLEGWLAPQKMADNLFKEFQSIASAELAVYREIKTGNERTVVYKDITSQLRGAWSCVETGATAIYNIGSTIGSSIGLRGSSNTPSSNNETDGLQID